MEVILSAGFVLGLLELLESSGLAKNIALVIVLVLSVGFSVLQAALPMLPETTRILVEAGVNGIAIVLSALGYVGTATRIRASGDGVFRAYFVGE